MSGVTLSGVAPAGDAPVRNTADIQAEYNKLIGVNFEACDTGAGGPAACTEEGCAEEGCAGEKCASGCGCFDHYLCGPDEAWTLNSALFPNNASPPFTIGGWTQNGFHNASDGLFNSHPNQLVSHQNYLYAERIADGSEGFALGGRADILYGADAQDTQAFGEPYPQHHWDTQWDHGAYGWAMPQLYAEAAYGDFSVKAGHFYTPVGYEVVTAPDNFFYSHSFTMYNSEPFTHTGVLGNYSPSDDTTVYLGWVAGWDTGFNRFGNAPFNSRTVGPEDSSKGSMVLFGISQALTDKLTVTYIGLAGDSGWRGEGYNHSFVADYKISDKWNYVFWSDVNEFNAVGQLDHSIGINNLLFYTITDQLAIGGRAEWWKAKYDIDGLDDGSVYQVTTGVNYKPMANLVVRPELRYQWGADQVIRGMSGAVSNKGATGQPGVSDNVIFGMDAILTF
jgi:hypothetical protein